MKAAFFVVSCALAVALVTLTVFAARQRQELQHENGTLTTEVTRLKKELAAAGPHVTRGSYVNRDLGFELRYPPELFSGQMPKASTSTTRNGMTGVQLTQERSGCRLEVYISSASVDSNPFDESGVAPKESRYVASSRLTFGGLAYYLGMGVVSHGVDPQRSCIPAFKEILPTVRLIPGAGSSAASMVPGARARSMFDSESLRKLGGTDPEGMVRQDLMKHPEIIPFHGVLGGTPGFHDPGSIVLLPGRWVFAGFDDGHVDGRLIASWKVSPDRTITWRLVAAECPGC